MILLKHNYALLRFQIQHQLSACVDMKSLNHIVSVSLSIGPQHLFQHQKPGEVGLIAVDTEKPRLISISGCRCGSSADCDIDKCIILPLLNIDSCCAFQLLYEMEEIA